MDTAQILEIIDEIRKWATPGLLVAIGVLAKYIWSTTLKQLREDIKSAKDDYSEKLNGAKSERDKLQKKLDNYIEIDRKEAKETIDKHRAELKEVETIVKEGLIEERKFWQEIFSRFDETIKSTESKVSSISQDLEGIKGRLDSELNRLDQRIDERIAFCDSHYKKND